MHEIEKNIPAPEGSRGRPAQLYPFLKMEIGDSFFVADGLLEKLRSSACQSGKRHGRKFIARRWEAGVRVWRIA